MESLHFLTVNNEPITLSQALRYWRNSGIFSRMLQEVLQQHCLKKEISKREDFKVEDFERDQACVEFRVQNQLTDGTLFQEWLASNKFTYETFQEQIAFTLKVEKLKSETVEPKLEDHFNRQKPFLDRVILSRLILEDKDLAEQLAQKISADPSNFESLVQTHSITDDRVANGMMGAVPKAQMPEILRTAIDSANPGDIVGPMEIEGRYCLFRIEKFVPATLDDLNLKQELMNQIFEQWINSKIQAMDIRLDIN